MPVELNHIRVKMYVCILVSKDSPDPKYDLSHLKPPSNFGLELIAQVVGSIVSCLGRDKGHGGVLLKSLP